MTFGSPALLVIEVRSWTTRVADPRYLGRNVGRLASTPFPAVGDVGHDVIWRFANDVVENVPPGSKGTILFVVPLIENEGLLCLIRPLQFPCKLHTACHHSCGCKFHAVRRETSVQSSLPHTEDMICNEFIIRCVKCLVMFDGFLPSHIDNFFGAPITTLATNDQNIWSDKHCTAFVIRKDDEPSRLVKIGSESAWGTTLSWKLLWHFVFPLFHWFCHGLGFCWLTYSCLLMAVVTILWFPAL